MKLPFPDEWLLAWEQEHGITLPKGARDELLALLDKLTQK